MGVLNEKRCKEIENKLTILSKPLLDKIL